MPWRHRGDIALKALVTGARGFIGRNLVVALRRAHIDIREADVETKPGTMVDSLVGARVVFHLAGVNRPETAKSNSSRAMSVH